LRTWQSFRRKNRFVTFCRRLGITPTGAEHFHY
jgi:hypothetical protein